MDKAVIGILSRVQVDRNDFYWDIEKTYVVSDYIQAVQAAGGIPIIIPLTLDDEILRAQIGMVDGIIVPGGIDINSLLYDEEPIKDQGFISEETDEFDIKSIKIAREMSKPILGICRGIQSINVAFDGSLYQDLSQIKTRYILHNQKAKRSFASHTINIHDDSILHDILGSKAIVNSFHHQSVKHVAPGFKITAYSEDGVVEAIESNEGFILGVQWHPESMITKYENMLKIFERFIEECKK